MNLEQMRKNSLVKCEETSSKRATFCRMFEEEGFKSYDPGFL